MDKNIHDLNYTNEKLKQTNIDKKHIDNILVGNVIQEVSTSNVAREASLACNISDKIPATTISQACISSAQSVSLGMDKIKLKESYH